MTVDRARRADDGRTGGQLQPQEHSRTWISGADDGRRARRGVWFRPKDGTWVLCRGHGCTDHRSTAPKQDREVAKPNDILLLTAYTFIFPVCRLYSVNRCKRNHDSTIRSAGLTRGENHWRSYQPNPAPTDVSPTCGRAPLDRSQCGQRFRRRSSSPHLVKHQNQFIN